MQPEKLPFGERRLNQRKTCSRMIQVMDRNGSYSGYLRDLTVGGGFIEPAAAGDASIGQQLLLTIPFKLKEGSVHVTAKVAWSDEYGMGVRFIAPPWMIEPHPQSL